jgi:hypothetical protein
MGSKFHYTSEGNMFHDTFAQLFYGVSGGWFPASADEGRSHRAPLKSHRAFPHRRTRDGAIGLLSRAIGLNRIGGRTIGFMGHRAQAACRTVFPHRRK